MPIIGLHGKIGSGKNLVADRLDVLFPGQIKRVSFFAATKEQAAYVLGVTVDDLEQWKNDPDVRVEVRKGYGHYSSISVRTFLQRYGEPFRRLCGDGYLLDDVLPLGADYSDFIYVATDVRHPSEARRVRELGGSVVGVVGRSTWGTGPEANHPIEAEIAADTVIANRDEGFDVLDREICMALERIGFIVQGHRFEGVAP